MQYELVSRALAYVSCFSTLSLLMTSVAIAAVNVGKVRPLHFCPTNACIAGVLVANETQFGGLTSRPHIEAVATRLWSVKI
jgi:hypothetical protein